MKSGWRNLSREKTKNKPKTTTKQTFKCFKGQAFESTLKLIHFSLVCYFYDSKKHSILQCRWRMIGSIFYLILVSNKNPWWWKFRQPTNKKKKSITNIRRLKKFQEFDICCWSFNLINITNCPIMSIHKCHILS